MQAPSHPLGALSIFCGLSAVLLYGHQRRHPQRYWNPLEPLRKLQAFLIGGPELLPLRSCSFSFGLSAAFLGGSLQLGVPTVSSFLAAWGFSF